MHLEISCDVTKICRMSNGPIDPAEELRRLRDDAARTVANLELSRQAIELELKTAKAVLKRIEQALATSEPDRGANERVR